MRTVYLILGRYQGNTEEIDETEDRKDAVYLRGEYAMAYGAGWAISIKKIRRAE